jgi:hypothetical protein
MRIGIIAGKTDEISLDKEINKMVAKKHYYYGSVHTDVALAYTMKKKFPNVTVDVIMPNELSDVRLQKNDINYAVGYDLINAINNDPYIKKFSGEKGYQKLDNIYYKKSNKIFPSYDFLNFIWDKRKYLQHLEKAGIPVTPSIFIKGDRGVDKLLNDITSRKWRQFIIKPIGGTIAIGLGIFKLSDCYQDPQLITDYFDENNEMFKEYIIQEKIVGFTTYGEIKTYWIEGAFSYAVNTPGATSPDDEYVVKEIIDKKVLAKCEEIGRNVLDVIPKVLFNHKKVLPAMIRIDFTCCKNNRKHSPINYFVNEIESDIAGTYTNFPNVKYPILDVMSDTYVKKSKELYPTKY